MCVCVCISTFSIMFEMYFLEIIKKIYKTNEIICIIYILPSENVYSIQNNTSNV